MAGSELEVTVTVKVALPPLLMLADGGETASQLPPVAVGVTVTLPLQVPVTPMVKLCVAGLVPCSALNDSAVAEGACNVQGGCTVRVTVTVCGVPIVWCVTLSVAVTVIVPVYVCGFNPDNVTPMAVVAPDLSLTVPEDEIGRAHV